MPLAVVDTSDESTAVHTSSKDTAFGDAAVALSPSKPNCAPMPKSYDLLDTRQSSVLIDLLSKSGLIKAPLPFMGGKLEGIVVQSFNDKTLPAFPSSSSSSLFS